MSLLTVDGLRMSLPTSGGMQPILTGVDFDLQAGESVGLVGESGSGKSMTARSIMRLLPDGARVEGAIEFDGRPVMEMAAKDLRAFRNGKVSMIFQDPAAYINPVHTIGDFLTEGVVAGRRMDRKQARRRALELLDEVGIEGPEHRLRQYPHELSGGMLQRVMIAGALISDPELLIADEPTTALDVTTQSEVMAILEDLRRSRGLAMLFITHDLELAAAVCDRIIVMYAGMVVEETTSDTLYRHPKHPYTGGLALARPDFSARRERLRDIPGQPMRAGDALTFCPFAPRCEFVRDRCREERPALREVDGAKAACHFSEDVGPVLAERLAIREEKAREGGAPGE